MNNEQLILEMLGTIIVKVDKIDSRVEQLENRFDILEERFDKLEERFDKLEERFDILENTVTAIMIQVAATTEDIVQLKEMAQSTNNRLEYFTDKVIEHDVDLFIIKKRASA